MLNKFYKKKKEFIKKIKLKILNKIKYKNKKKIKVKFCVFAGRKSNLEILHEYIKILLNENIIQEYHIFDFTRNKIDKEYLYQSFLFLKKNYNKKIFIHNKNNNININNNQYDWSPFYIKISKKKFYKNSIIIKCDDDILFIDINGLKNAIKNRINDKKSFLIHSNCINNNICSYFQQNKFPLLKNKLNIYPKGGILGSIFENPKFAYIMQYQFINDYIDNLNNLYNYYLKDIYINTRISINFILINGEDCKYFKNTNFNDEYELSSYYPEKLLRPNKIIGNFITCHYSYSLQEKILLKTNDLKKLYKKLLEKYELDYKKVDYKYKNELLNEYRVNKISKNKFYVNNYLYGKYNISVNGKYLYINFDKNKIEICKKKSYFEIKEIDINKVIINLGIYNLNKYNLINDFKNRNLLIKLLYDQSENIIEMIKKDNLYYLKFQKNNLFINEKNNRIELNNKAETLWKINKYENKEKIYIKRYKKNKKFYYKNLNNNNVFTNFYMGWGNENILDIIEK